MFAYPLIKVLRLTCCCLVCGLFFESCKQQHKEFKPYANNLGIKPAKLAQIDTVHYTTVEWTEPNRNFGTVNEGDSVVFKYKYKNTGVHPLFIAGVKLACGCTAARYPEEPVMPGQSAELSATFNTTNYPGEVHKTIIVTTNTSNGVKHVLTIAGNVIEKK